MSTCSALICAVQPSQSAAGQTGAAAEAVPCCVRSQKQLPLQPELLGVQLGAPGPAVRAACRSAH